MRGIPRGKDGGVQERHGVYRRVRRHVQTLVRGAGGLHRKDPGRGATRGTRHGSRGGEQSGSRRRSADHDGERGAICKQIPP